MAKHNILTMVLLEFGRIIVNGWHTRKLDSQSARNLVQRLNTEIEINKHLKNQVASLQSIIDGYERLHKARRP